MVADSERGKRRGGDESLQGLLLVDGVVLEAATDAPSSCTFHFPPSLLISCRPHRARGGTEVPGTGGHREPGKRKAGLGWGLQKRVSLPACVR